MAISAGAIEGLLQLRDELTPALRAAEAAANRSRSSINNVLQGIGQGLGQKLFEGVTQGARLAGDAVAYLASRGGEVESITRSFEALSGALGQTSSAMLGEFRAGSQGMVSDMALMQAANKAMLLGLPVTGQEMRVLGETAVTLGKAMGVDATQAISDLVTGLGRGSAAILDNLGITVNAEEAYASYAASLGKTADQLTASEKKIAVYTSALGAAKAKVEEIGGVHLTLADRVQQVKTQWDNFVDSMAAAIQSSPAVQAAVEGVVQILQTLMKQLQDNRQGLLELVKGGVLVFLGALAGVGAVVTGALAVLQTMVEGVTKVGVSFARSVEAVAKFGAAVAKVKGDAAGAEGFDRLAREAKDVGDALTGFGGGWSEAIGKAKDGTAAMTLAVADLAVKVAGTSASVKDTGNSLSDLGPKGKQGAAGVKLTAEEVKKLQDAFAKAGEGFRQFMAARAEAHAGLVGLLGPDAADASLEMGRLASAVDAVGGVSQLTDAQLVKLVDSMREQARLGGDNAYGFEALAAAMDEAAQRGDAVAEAVGFATDSVQDCGDAAEETALWFEKWLDLAALLSDAFRELGLDALASVADGFLAGADAATQFESATTKAGKAAAIAQGAMSAYRSGSAIGGATTGAMLGFQIGGPLGAGIGAVGGALLGLFGKAKKAREEMRKLRDSFIDSMGGLDSLRQKAASAGVSLDAMFKAKNAKQLEAAIAGIKSKLDLWDEAHEKLQAAVEKYGFTIEELGPKFKQQALDEMAANLIQDFRLLTASGIDQVTVLTRMGPAFNEYVQTAMRAGAALPEAMRPMIEQLIASGQLLDENGNAFTSVEQAGLSFTETLTEGLTRLIDKIDQLVSALGGVGGAASRVTIPGGNLPGSSGGKYFDAADLPGFAGGTPGFLNFGSGTPVMLHGREAVVPATDWRSFAGPSQVGNGPISIDLSLQTGDVLIPAGSTLDPNQVAQAMTVAWRNNIQGLADQVLAKVKERVSA